MQGEVGEELAPMRIITNTEGAVKEEISIETRRKTLQEVDEAVTNIIKTLTKMMIQDVALIAADSEEVVAVLAGEVITTGEMDKTSDVEVAEVAETLFTDDLGPKTKISFL